MNKTRPEPACIKDMVRTGTGVMKDGKRIDPKDFYDTDRVSISRECAEAMLVSRKEHLYPSERGDKYIREIEQALEAANE